MSATVGAALKKVAVGLLLDKRNWDKIICLILTLAILVFAPGAGAAAMISSADFSQLDTTALAS